MNTLIQQSFNIVSEYNSKNYQANIKALKADNFLYSIFTDRIKYLSLDKKTVLSFIKAIAARYAVKLIKNDNFNDGLYRANYNGNSYSDYELNQKVSDFKYVVYLVKNLILAKNTVNKKYLFLKSIVESFPVEYVKKGYGLDFYCHDYNEITNNDNLSDFVWLTKTEYLSTHIMHKNDYAKFISSTGCEYIIIDLLTMERITL